MPAAGDRLYRIAIWWKNPSPQDAPSNLAIIGRYVLTPGGLPIARDHRAGHRRRDCNSPMADRHLPRSRPIYALRFEGTRYDAGDKLGFLKATVEFALGAIWAGRSASTSRGLKL